MYKRILSQKILAAIFILFEIGALLYYAPWVVGMIFAGLLVTILTGVACSVLFTSKKDIDNWLEIGKEHNELMRKMLYDANGFPEIHNRRAADKFTDFDGKIRK